MKKLNKTYKKLHNKVVELTLANGLSHLSSCLTTLPILFHVYETKNANDVVILSNGHAGLSQYVCMEHYEKKEAQKLLDQHGIHPSRDAENSIFCSTGSLGLGLPIAMGAALANSQKTVYCIISDGECCEGSIWESLYYLSKTPIKNLKIFVNANGMSAYSLIDIKKLKACIKGFNVSNITIVDTTHIIRAFPLLESKGLESHYFKITDTTAKELQYEI
jgi:transketolase